MRLNIRVDSIKHRPVIGDKARINHKHDPCFAVPRGFKGIDERSVRRIENATGEVDPVVERDVESFME